MQTISGTPIPEIMSKPIDKEEIFEISHNFYMKNGLPFKEILLPLTEVTNNGNFLADDCPIVVKTADRQAAYCTYKHGLAFHDEHVLRDTVYRIYKMDLEKYLSLWVEKTGEDKEYLKKRFIYMKIEEIKHD